MISEYEKWRGSQDELIEVINQLELAMFQIDKPVKKRTLVYYRQQGVITAPTGKKYSYHHILQFLLSRKLAREGWTIKQLSQAVPNLTIDDCIRLIEHKGDSADLIEALKVHPQSEKLSLQTEQHLNDETNDVPLPELAVKLLALAVIKLYEETVSQNQIVDSNAINKNMVRAMGVLGRLCIDEGLEDSFASVHETLKLCRLPFGHPDWPLSPFKENQFPYQLSNLIDIDLRTPTSDCLALASFGGERNIRENYHFEQLILTCENFGHRKAEAYTQLREFIGRNPISTKGSIESYLQEHNFKSAIRFLVHECYRDVEPAWLAEEKLYKCSECNAPLKYIGNGVANCVIKQCSKYHQHVELIHEVESADFLMLKPHLMSDWFGPAIDEVYLYDLAVELQLDVALYPDTDACDIAIDGIDIGIDIKSYASPYLLAKKLTKSIGRLANYQHKIVAVNDMALRRTPRYLEILEQEYRGSESLEFKSVKDLANWLKEAR